MKTKDIVLICDDNYCIPTEVCIQSIIRNAPKDSEILKIHVCTFGLTEHNKKKLEELSNDNAVVTIDVFNENDYAERIQQVNQKSHVTPTALIKFELPSFFSNIESILYLDGDIIVKKNLSELLDYDIQNYYLAASFEFWAYMNAVKYSFNRKVPFYFNSGVMLLNLKKMREDEITDKLWYYKLNLSHTTLMDQESLNAICAVNTLPLSVEWNFNPVFLDREYLPYINRVFKTNYKNTADLIESVNIIHYVGKADKPWVYKNARLRCYWDDSNNSLRNPEKLDLKEIIIPKRTHYMAIKEKIKSFGLIGTLKYTLFKLRTRLLHTIYE